MYLEREIFHAKVGKAGQLVKLFKEYDKLTRGKKFKKARIMTDLSGKFWTVVFEREIKSIDGLAVETRRLNNNPKVKALFKDYHDLVDGGSRELYKIEQ
jgi:hypothetical protein